MVPHCKTSNYGVLYAWHTSKFLNNILMKLWQIVTEKKSFFISWIELIPGWTNTSPQVFMAKIKFKTKIKNTNDIDSRTATIALQEYETHTQEIKAPVLRSPTMRRSLKNLLMEESGVNYLPKTVNKPWLSGTAKKSCEKKKCHSGLTNNPKAFDSRR